MSFVETTSMLYDSYDWRSILIRSVADMCTEETCPEMSAGAHYSYYWTDFNGSNPVPVGVFGGGEEKMSAKLYITTLFQSISDLFHSSPYNKCASGVFPDNFMHTSRAIFKKLFRVYAHVYHHHLNVDAEWWDHA